VIERECVCLCNYLHLSIVCVCLSVYVCVLVFVKRRLTRKQVETRSPHSPTNGKCQRGDFLLWSLSLSLYDEKKSFFESLNKKKFLTKKWHFKVPRRLSLSLSLPLPPCLSHVLHSLLTNSQFHFASLSSTHTFSL
jgi:hypothetical protein